MGSSIFSTCLMSVKNHDSVNTNIPSPEHPKKRLAVPVSATIVPESIMPNGCAAEANAIVTEFTLPCIFIGTIVWMIV